MRTQEFPLLPRQRGAILALPSSAPFLLFTPPLRFFPATFPLVIPVPLPVFPCIPLYISAPPFLWICGFSMFTSHTTLISLHSPVLSGTFFKHCQVLQTSMYLFLQLSFNVLISPAQFFLLPPLLPWLTPTFLLTLYCLFSLLYNHSLVFFLVQFFFSFLSPFTTPISVSLPFQACWILSSPSAKSSPWSSMMLFLKEIQS